MAGIEPIASHPEKGTALPLSYTTLGAKDRIRTGDPDLGKVMLYQLSYFRKDPNISEGSISCGGGTRTPDHKVMSLVS